MPTRRGFLQASALGTCGIAWGGEAIQAAAGWTRPGGTVPPGEWWAGGGPRQAPHSCVIVGAEEPGERLVLSGTVYDSDGQTPLSGVTVYVYQTDARGLYNPEGRFGVPHRIRGWANTDAAGRYEFSTIRPGYYPNRATPAHIHMTVSRDDLPEWWLPEVRFEGDPLLTAEDARAVSEEGRFANIRALVARGGLLHCTRDLRL